MHPLEKATLAVLRRDSLVRPGDIVLAAVSGGPDSMAMLHVLARLIPNFGLILHAAYINHGLRPREARREEELVRERAESLGVEFHLAAADVRNLARQRKQSIEHTARLERYRLLEEIGSSIEASRIALGHTADDQAEELLLRLIRGTGRMGLSGMRTMRVGRFIRPFLGTEKRKLLAYLADRNIPFLIDSSNRQRNYLRNRVRLDLLPYLAERFNANIYRTLRQTADILGEEEEVLEKLANEAWSHVVVDVPPVHESAKQAPLTLALDLKNFNSMSRALKRRIIEKCCWRLECEPRFRQVEQILRLADGTGPGTLHLGGGLRADRAAGSINFDYPKGQGPYRGDLSDNKGSFEMRIEAPGRFKVESLGKVITLELLNRVPENVVSTEPAEFLDLRRISFPLTLRSPRPGDRFHPLGSPGNRKVGDFLTDKKIPPADRWRVPVLLSGKDIVALVGLRLDHRFRITSDTNSVMLLRWQDNET